MLIPLWIPWVLAVGLLVLALNVVRPRAEDNDDQFARRVRTWWPVTLVTLVALALTWGRINVSEEEMEEAGSAAADLVAGDARFSAGKVERLISERLGREVRLEGGYSSPDEENVRRYELTTSAPGVDEYEALACLEVTDYSEQGFSVSVDAGPCDDA